MQANPAAATAAGLAEMVLKYPEQLGLHPQLTFETALQYLLKAHQLAAQVPFQFGYIDKPQDGSLFMVYLLPQQRVYPNDGIRYQDQEQRYTIPAGGNRELEVSESKFGFIPESNDTSAYRLRRRFRLSRGGSPQLMLVHYAVGQSAQILPALRSQPVRAYPLRPIMEPGMYVYGDKTGQRVPGQRAPMPSATAVPSMAGMGGGMQHQAVMLAQQNREMEQLERRQARERAAGMGGHVQQQPADADSGDEIDHISNRSLALARYKRNHEFMNEIFMHAAFGDKKPKEIQDPYAIFKEDEMKENIAKMEKGIKDLHEKAASRQAEAAQRDRIESGGSLNTDVSMEGIQLPVLQV